MKALLAIKSCWQNLGRRRAIRETWLPDVEWADYTFVLGEHEPQRLYGSKVSNMYSEEGLRVYPIKDDFPNIAPKVHRVMQDAIQEGYDRTVVLDDDTYVVPHRLRPYVTDCAPDDYIGFKRADAGCFGKEPYMHGAAYIIGANVMKLLAESTELVDKIPDDVVVGRVLSRVPSVNFKHEDIFWPGPRFMNPWSRSGLSTSHKCFPDLMRGVYKAQR